MYKIDFKNNQIDFWKARVISSKEKIDVHEILRQAYDQNVLLDNNSELLSSFVECAKNFRKNYNAQLLQDIFAAFIIDKKYQKTFLEFGATNGISLSNTFLLEKELNWTGALAEPDTQWQSSLQQNRPEAKIIPECIWKKSNEKLNFFSSNIGVLSTLDEFKFSDSESMPANSNERNKQGKNILVDTISLNDVIEKYFNGVCPSYISVDTEGSEFEILNAFNLSDYRPLVLTVEHNFTNAQNQIDELMTNNNYLRIFKKLTVFDAWYVSNEAFNSIL